MLDLPKHPTNLKKLGLGLKKLCVFFVGSLVGLVVSFVRVTDL
jgi:hypothetical protein